MLTSIKKRTAIVAALGALIIIVLAGVVVPASFERSGIHIDLRSFFTLLNAPEEVKDMLFVTKIEGGEALSQIRSGGIQTFAFPAKHFIQLARSGDTVLALALVEQTGSGAVDVYHVNGAELTPLTTDGGKKGGITLSPDGLRFAYSAEGPALPGTIEDAYDVRRYITHVANASGEELFALPGNHPYFLNDKLLLVLNERGFEVYDLETGAGNATSDDLAFLAIERPLYSTGGIFIAKNPITSESLVMRFASYDPVVFELLGTRSKSEDTRVALDGTLRWEGRTADGVFTLIRFDDAASESGMVALSLAAGTLNPLAIVP